MSNELFAICWKNGLIITVFGAANTVPSSNRIVIKVKAIRFITNN